MGVNEKSTGDVRLPVLRSWIRFVAGREYSKYIAIAKKKPRRSIFRLPVIDPLSLPANIWGSIVLFIDLVYTAFLVPLSLAFNQSLGVNAYTIFDIIGSSVYICGILFDFHIGFIVKWDAASVVITDGWEVAKHYVRYGTFVIDVIAALPIILQILFVIFRSFSYNQEAIRLLLILKLLRLLRVVHILKYIGNVGEDALSHRLSTMFNAGTMLLVATFYSLVVLVNLMACVWWWIAIVEGLSQSWVEPVSASKPLIDLYNTNDGRRWVVCAYFALVTMTTIGYGDITSYTVSEMVVNIIFILTSVAYFGFLLNNINVLFSRRKAGDVSTSAKLEYLHQMDGWMRKYSFPKKLKRQIRDYYFTNLIMPADQEEELGFYYDLPTTLRLKVVTEIQHGDLINALLGPPPSDPAWTDDDHHLTQHERVLASEALALASEPRHVLHNTTIYTVGDVADCFYLLEQGQVTVSLQSRKAAKTVAYAPAVLGLSAAFQSWAEPFGVYSSRVRSLTSCVLWKIDVKRLLEELVPAVPKALLVMLGKLRSSVVESINELERDRPGLDVRVSELIRRYKEKIELLDSIETSLRATVLSEKSVASNFRLPSLRKIEDAEQGEQGQPVAGTSVQDENELARRITSHDSIQLALDQLNRRQATLQNIETFNRRQGVVDGVVKFENSEATFVL